MRARKTALSRAVVLCLAPLSVAAPQHALAQDSEADNGSEAAQTEEKIENLDFMRLLESLRTPQVPAYDPTKPVVGIGVQRTDDKIRIAQVVDGSAAKEAGLEVGMIITRINGLRMDDFQTVEVVKILGAIDGEINLDIEGKGRFSLVKAPIEQVKE